MLSTTWPIASTGTFIQWEVLLHKIASEERGGCAVPLYSVNQATLTHGPRAHSLTANQPNYLSLWRDILLGNASSQALPETKLERQSLRYAVLALLSRFRSAGVWGHSGAQNISLGKCSQKRASNVDCRPQSDRPHGELASPRPNRADTYIHYIIIARHSQWCNSILLATLQTSWLELYKR